MKIVTKRSGNRVNRSVGFTLTELLVVMAIIVILAGLTAISVRSISKDAKLTSSQNALMAALDTARALAMKNNQLVLVVFRPRWESKTSQYVEIVPCMWTGETYTGSSVVDRFEPIPDAMVTRLASGIHVAGPMFGRSWGTGNYDSEWSTQVFLPDINQDTGLGEYPGQMIAVMYGPDGATRSRNSQSDSNAAWVDFNRNRIREVYTSGTTYVEGGFDVSEASFEQRFEGDEPTIAPVPYLAVYDNDQAREMRSTDWSEYGNYKLELTGPNGYISNFADRIHFNRYTGVALK